MSNPVALQYKRIESLPIHTGPLPKDSVLLVVIGNQTYQWTVETITDNDIDELFGETNPDGSVKLPFEYITDKDIDDLFRNSNLDSPDNDPVDVQDLLATIYDIDIMYDNDPNNNIEPADPDDPNSYPYDFDNITDADLATKSDIDLLFPEDVEDLLASVYDIDTMYDDDPTNDIPPADPEDPDSYTFTEEQVQDADVATNEDIDSLFS